MNLDVAIVGSARAFHALADDWDTLFKSASRATPFQSWPWLSSWWESFGSPRVLRVVTVRRGGELVGALPLMLDRRLVRARLEFIGTGLSDHLDGLVVDGLETPVVEMWAHALRQLGGWTVADLQEVRPTAVGWELLEHWSPATSLPQSICSERAVQPWQDFLTPMSKNARGQMRRSVRAAESAGVVARRVTGVEVPAAVDGLLEGHRAQWAGRGQAITSEHLTDRFHRFLRRSVPGMVERDEACLIEFRDDLDVLARVLVLVGRDYVGDYLYSATPRALQTYSIRALIVHASLRVAEAGQVPAINFLRGDEPWKRRWAPDIQPNHRLVLGRARPAWAAFVGYHRGRSWAADQVRSDDAPEWVGRVVQQFEARR